ncbi:MAG: hypothetical protein WKF88_10205 [Ferruginibacter sp.]
MKNFLKLLTASLFLLVLHACQKNVDTFIPDSINSTPDTVWQNSLTANMPVIALKNELRRPKITDSFAYNNTGVVYNAGNLFLTVPPSGLVTNAGSVPNGNIHRQSLLIQKKGDFISMGMPTVCNGQLLITGGAFFLGLKNNNNEVNVSTGTSLGIRYDHNSTVTGMKVYNSIEDIITGFAWTQNTDIIYNNVNIVNNGYEVLSNRMQWIQAAYLFDTTGIPQTTFSLKLPVNYTNANTVAYISFNNMACVAGMNANVAARRFISGNLPVNSPITIVVISKQVNDYYLGVQQTVAGTPSSGAGTQDVIISPVKTPLSSIRSFLNNL